MSTVKPPKVNPLVENGRLTELGKILLVNGGTNHATLRRGRDLIRPRKSDRKRRRGDDA